MHPARTNYYLVTTQQESRRCRAFLAAQGEHTRRIQYPTVYAEREQAVVGVLGSHYRQGCLAAGPLIVATRRPIFVGLRLLEAYEDLLKRSGVRTYMFAVEKTQPHWKAALDAFGLGPLRETDDVWLYRKEVA